MEHERDRGPGDVAHFNQLGPVRSVGRSVSPRDGTNSHLAALCIRESVAP